MWHTCQPEDLHKLARAWFLKDQRIELQKLARELGISRATAYRWAGNTEQLVGDVLASLVDETFKQFVKQSTSRGAPLVREVLEHGMRSAHVFKPLRDFLARDPQVGLRMVASKYGPVQKKTIANLNWLLQREVDAGFLSLAVEPGVMAYVLTRTTETFLYADLITGEALDLDSASEILKLLLRQDTVKC